MSETKSETNEDAKIETAEGAAATDGALADEALEQVAGGTRSDLAAKLQLALQEANKVY